MSDSEFDKIKQMFPPEMFEVDFSEKALRHFQELMEKLEDGTDEEKAEAKRQLATYEKASGKIRQELAQKLHKSEDEVKRIITNESNFSKTEWKRIQEAKKEMTPIVQEAQKGKKKKKKRSSKEDKWLKS